MELGLNILWLAMVATSAAWWVLARPSLRRRRKARLRELGAMVFSLVFLFPVISLTDDLHEQPVTCEDPAASKPIVQCGEHGHGPSSQLQGPPSGTLAAMALLIVPVAWISWQAEPVANSSFPGPCIASAPNRAPPPTL